MRCQSSALFILDYLKLSDVASIGKKREKYKCCHLEKGCGNGEWNGYKELSAWISVRCRHEIKGYLCPGKKGLKGPNTNINKKKNKVWRKCKKWNIYITKK